MLYCITENEYLSYYSLVFRIPKLYQIRFDFVTSLPDFAEDNSRVEAVEDGQRHADVHDDNPWPKTEEL